ncbi:MAG: CRISPR-associated endonuclease Cas1 [Candidatus Omnitrophica bacterium]|nr:CRISPR-associated endonuclease Cas1 [Candidatus Omnitrophota bacterium]
MSILYLLEQGAKLEKESKRIVVKKEDKILLEVPEFKIDRVMIFGNIQITTQAMKFLLEQGIETSFFTIYGKLIGKLTPIQSKNVLLRIAQFEKSKDPEFRLAISKTIVEGKIKNARAFLQRFSRNHPEVDFSQSIKDLDSCLEELLRKTGIGRLVGLEGRASAIYFEAFGKMFRKELKFEERFRRPPPDPVNSLLGLGYTLITNEMFSVLASIGFDPYIGFLHHIEYGRPSLALDLIEEFRHSIIDRLTLELVNKNILTKDDFEEHQQGVYLKDEAKKKFFQQYERRILTSFTDWEENSEVNYRRMFYLQAQRFAKTIQEGAPYIPFSIR